MEAFLETDRLVLWRFTPADVDLLVDLDSDPDVMHFVTESQRQRLVVHLVGKDRLSSYTSSVGKQVSNGSSWYMDCASPYDVTLRYREF